MTRDTFLHLRKRRYRCCCGKRFFEKNAFLPRYYRVTSRLVAEIIFAFKKFVSAKEIGCRFNVSGMTEYSAFPEPGVQCVRATIPVGQCQCSGQ